MLDFKYRVFLSVARLASFSKAAKELSLTQPAVSFQIRHLEEELKARLFVRYPNRIELTPIGSFLFGELTRLAGESAKVRERVMQKLGKFWGTMVMGASTTIGNYFMPTAIAEFKAKYPGIATRILVDNTDQVLNYLADGIIDFAIVEGPVKPRQWITEELFTDELVVIVPKDFQGAGKGTIPIQRVGQERFISREAGSGTRAVIDDLRTGQKPLIPPENVVLELGSSTAIKKGVEGGLGISIVSVMTLENELQLGTLRALRIEKFPIYRKISLVFPRGVEQSQAISDMVAVCKEHGKRITALSGAR
ncbi:MAG: LysR family transcriptional regulator [Nitrospinae bacterium]|nr:LysR family transcriptional regulator [Nitrospinota bacterium]